jgi:RNA methyltransferase, TrmH family
VRVLTSLKNPKVSVVARLKKRAFRDEQRAFLVEGAQAVGEALERDPPGLTALIVDDPVRPIAVRAGERGIEVLHVSPEVIRSLTSTVTPQGILGVARYLDGSIEAFAGEGASCVAVLHEVRDPGNAGTILRSADAAGADGVVFTSSSVDPYNPKTVRASAGSIFHVPVVRDVPTPDAIGSLRELGYRTFAMDARGSENLYGLDLSGKVAFVFGNEARGLPQDVVRLADATVRVPLAGAAESLNLAAAATVCLFEWTRRRVGKGAALEALIAAAAHDIRSPLTAMKGFGYALEKRWDQLDDDQRALMLRGIVHDADRMDQIVRLLVDAARVAAGSLELFPDQTDVADLAAAISELLGRDPEHPPVTWAGDPGPFFVDTARLKTTLLSYEEALAWWAGEGGTTISAERDDGDLHVWARRAGATIDRSAAEALFTPRKPGSGAGSKIGLYVARAVAEAQGGRAWAEVNGDELSFHLRVPLPG